MNTDAKTLSHALGERMRHVRDTNGERQDDVAERARGIGLGWTRSVVAAIESGRRQLTAEEFVLLPWVMVSEMADLVVGLPPIRIGEDSTLNPELVLRFLTDRDGGAPCTKTSELGDVPMVRELAEAAESIKGRGGLDAIWKDKIGRYRSVWPKVRTFGDIQEVADAARGEAEQRAARKWRVDPVLVALAAHRLWGRGLQKERDARVAATDHDGSTRALRGHVTRQLLSELEPIVREHADEWRD